MKRLSILAKIILSIVVGTTIGYAMVGFFSEEPLFILTNNVHYGLMALNFIILIYLLYRLFSFKKTSTETKVLWAVLLILISPSMLYYIWVTDDKKVMENMDS